MPCHFKLKPSLFALLAGFSGLSPLAGAQENVLSPVRVESRLERADGPVEGYRASRSATFTKTDTPLKEVPASITVVPGEVIKDQAMNSMADVFRYVPGATAHQGEGNRDQVVLRGNSTTADFFIDGIRDDALIFRDLYNLERVEVLKGPGGMAFGRGGAGGVVNRVSKKPVFGHVGEASLTVGSYGQIRGTVDAGGKINDAAAWRINAMAEGADSFRDGVDMKRYAINPSVTFLLTPATALTLNYEHLHDDRTADRGFPSASGRPYQADRSTFFGNSEQSNAKSTVDSLAATLEHDFGNGMQIKNSFRAAHYDKFYQNVYPGGAVNTAGTMNLSAYNNANQRSNFFNQTDLTAKFTTGSLQHTLLAGVELGHQDSENQRNTGYFGNATSLTVRATSPYGVVTSFRPATTDARNKVTADIAAAYVQDQISLSEQWKVLAGLRYDHFKTDFDDRRTLTRPTDLSRTDNAWSPRLGLIWTPTPSQTYYASYSYAFLPSAETLSLAPNTADLAPEKSINYEIGARWDLLPKLALSAATFRTDRTDVKVSDPAHPGYYVKTGQQRTDGAELGLQGEVTKQWRIYGGYAYLDGRITKATSNGAEGARIGLVPLHSLSLWNRYDFNAQWAAGLGLIHQSDAYTSYTNTVKLPAFTRVDGAVYYTFEGGKTRLALNLENLFDKKYFPTANGDNNISPGAPRSARLTLSTSF